MEAESELAEYLDISQRRRRLFPRAALVGLLAGAVALLFRALLAWGDQLRNGLIAWSQQFPALGWIAPAGFGAGGATLAVLLVRRYAPEAAGSGIPHTKAVLYRLRDLPWQRVLPIKLVGGALALGSGLALGREGSTVQMGGAVGAAVAARLKSPIRERLTLIAAGAGAGLAAAFNAPLAGLVFVLEELQRDFRPGVFGAAFIAAAVADILARLVGGQLPVFAVPSYPVAPLAALPIFAALGALAGLLGILFNHGLLSALNRFGRLTERQRLGATACIGAGVGLSGWFAPALIGSGHALTEQVLVGELALTVIPLILVLRFGLTLASYGTGAPGGIFAPLLVIGALIGLGVGETAHALAPGVVPIPAAFAVVGMAAYFTAIVRAPLTGIVLIVEMTGNYNQMLPLLVACFAAYLVAEGLRQLPIYEALLQRDRQHSSHAHTFHEPTVLELTIEPGAPFVGRPIRDLGLPPGCIMVRCRDGAREWIPTADTRLDAHMQCTFVIAPEAAPALRLLREGCEAPV
jgi:CIC family chloride channel protein